MPLPVEESNVPWDAPQTNVHMILGGPDLARFRVSVTVRRVEMLSLLSLIDVVLKLWLATIGPHPLHPRLRTETMSLNDHSTLNDG
jgi:hypothetical protein